MLNKVNETFKDIYDAIDVMETTINEQRTEIKRLRDMEQMDQLLIKELLGKSEQLLKERDEARREICHTKKRRLVTHLDYARKRGWNCFWVDYSKQQETP
jgi:chromosome segregation ATPase